MTEKLEVKASAVLEITATCKDGRKVALNLYECMNSEYCKYKFEWGFRKYCGHEINKKVNREELDGEYQEEARV